MTETPPRQTRYFWTDWFHGQSFATLALLFSLLSFVDLLATMRMMRLGIREGNVLADAAIKHGGAPAFILYKIALVLLVIGATWLVNRHRPALASGVLWFGNLLMAFIAILHLAIISGMFTGMVAE